MSTHNAAGYAAAKQVLRTHVALAPGDNATSADFEVWGRRFMQLWGDLRWIGMDDVDIRHMISTASGVLRDCGTSHWLEWGHEILPELVVAVEAGHSSQPFAVVPPSRPHRAVLQKTPRVVQEASEDKDDEEPLVRRRLTKVRPSTPQLMESASHRELTPWVGFGQAGHAVRESPAVSATHARHDEDEDIEMRSSPEHVAESDDGTQQGEKMEESEDEEDQLVDELEEVGSRVTRSSGKSGRSAKSAKRSAKGKARKSMQKAKKARTECDYCVGDCANPFTVLSRRGRPRAITARGQGRVAPSVDPAVTASARASRQVGRHAGAHVAGLSCIVIDVHGFGGLRDGLAPDDLAGTGLSAESQVTICMLRMERELLEGHQRVLQDMMAALQTAEMELTGKEWSKSEKEDSSDGSSEDGEGDADE
ncbi:hypothetical protein A0H81_03903 [Grifola frondosa]|uniref:Uncharacterized protein n=1 Tax=Grifola frondosa TaxID=5627 RepID=A0A1C7MH26_GRIFR|nr:hypothetical protein A0H81_03903 [Grifola frondosa]